MVSFGHGRIASGWLVKVTSLVLMTWLFGWALPIRIPAQSSLGAVRFDLKGKRSRLKARQDLLIRTVIRGNPDEDQLEVYNRDGSRKLSLNLLKSLPEARSLAIWDFSIGQSGLLAVGAVARSEKDELSSHLLIYDLSGQLLSAARLPAGKEVRKLEVDEDDSIWVMGAGSGGKDPKEVAMITRFGREGQVLEEFLPRSQFSLHAKSTEEAPEVGGRISFGLTKELVWMWLPPGQLVTLRKDGSDVQIADTGLPRWPGPLDPPAHSRISVEGCFLLPSGRLLANVWFYSGEETSMVLSDWDPGTGEWHTIPRLAYDASDSSLFLVGVEQGEMAMSRAVKGDRNHSEVCWYAAPVQ
ncbi:MAG: hypothetical protein AB1898_00010 [Acidobacteriota bacterium]